MIYPSQNKANQENISFLGHQSIHLPKPLNMNEKNNFLEEKIQPLIQKNNSSIKIRHLRTEYEKIMQYGPVIGIYVLPKFEDFFTWEFYLFLRDGYYKDAKLQGEIKLDRQKSHQILTLKFLSQVFHPFICFQTGKVDLQKFYPRNFQASLSLIDFFTALKKIFTERQNFKVENSLNPQAAKTFKKSQNLFIQKIFESTVIPSQKQLFDESEVTSDGHFKENQIFTKKIHIQQGIKQRLQQICPHSLHCQQPILPELGQQNQETVEKKAQNLLEMIMKPDFHFQF